MPQIRWTEGVCPLKGYLWEGGHGQNQGPPSQFAALVPPTSSQSCLEIPRKEPSVYLFRFEKHDSQRGGWKQAKANRGAPPPHTASCTKPVPSGTLSTENRFGSACGSSWPLSYTTPSPRSVQLLAHQDSRSQWGRTSWDRDICFLSSATILSQPCRATTSQSVCRAPL